MNILSALSQGFTITQVIDWLKKNDKILGSKIKEALRQGHTEDEIGQYLTKGASISYAKRQNLLSGMSEKEKGERIANYQPPIETALRKALPAAAIGLAGAAAAPALIRSLPVAAQQLLGLGGPGTGPGGSPTAAPIPTAAATAPPGAPPQAPTPAAGAAVAGAVGQAIAKGQGAVLFNQMGDKVTGIIKSLAGQQDPETIAAVLDQKILSPGQKKWLSQQGADDLPGLVADYLSTLPPEQSSAPPAEQPATQAAPPPEAPQPTAVAPAQAHAEKPKEEITVGGSAQLPSGDIGKIESVKNGIAKITVDGKERHVKADELEAAPLPEKDLADLFDELKARIEKETGEEISRMAGFVGFNAENNELAFRGHTGDLYIFDEIDPEDIKFLTEATVMRKTTGENYIGPWYKGTKTVMGAKMHELFNKYRARAEERARPSAGELSETGVPIETEKGKAHKAKFETVYSPFDIAHKASAAKKAAAKKAEREKERAAKKEAKEREKAERKTTKKTKKPAG